MNKIYRKEKGLLFKKIANEMVIVHAFEKKNNAEESPVFYLEDPTSVQIWELIDGKRTISQIVEKTAAIFNKTKDSIKDDVVDFLLDLKANGIITETCRDKKE